VDLHAITVPDDDLTSGKLRDRIRTVAASLLASGLDPKRCVIFQQSHLPQHCEMTWILGCSTATMARLNRLGQYKERSAIYKEGNIPLGLFIYPVLQAADILLYKATHVPVGEDQVAHINLCSDLAVKFNERIAKIFPIPQCVLSDNSMAIRIRSLKTPDKIMGKSEPTPRGRIELTDSADEIREKFKKAITDMTPEITFDPKQRPGVSNLVLIHSLFTGLSPEEIVCQSRGQNTANYKLLVADVVIQALKPMRDETLRLLDHKSHLDDIFEQGRLKAAEIASVTMQEVREVLGMIPSTKAENFTRRSQV